MTKTGKVVDILTCVAEKTVAFPRWIWQRTGREIPERWDRWPLAGDDDDDLEMDGEPAKNGNVDRVANRLQHLKK